MALVGAYGVLGLGASFAIAYVIAAAWALQILSYKVSGFSMRTVLTSLFRMIVAATLMGESVWFIVRSVGGNQGGGAFIRLAVGTFVGIVVYGVLLAAMGAPELDALRRRLPARLSGRPPSPAD